MCDRDSFAEVVSEKHGNTTVDLFKAPFSLTKHMEYLWHLSSEQFVFHNHNELKGVTYHNRIQNPTSFIQLYSSYRVLFSQLTNFLYHLSTLWCSNEVA